MRDSGYRNTAYALAELIDNSVQANANSVDVICVEEYTQLKQRRRRRMNAIGVLDDGCGMTPDVLRLALQFGNGTHLSDPERYWAVWHGLYPTHRFHSAVEWRYGRGDTVPIMHSIPF